MPVQRGDHVEETSTEARQGANVGWQLRVLVLSTMAAAAGLLYYFFVYAAP